VPEPQILDAKELALRYRKVGALILTFDSKGFCFASYGMTRPMCDMMGHVGDQILARISDGTISPEKEVPPNHYRPHGEGLIACGCETVGALWSVKASEVTCPKCHEWIDEELA
jgi:hypothetical protein